MYIYLYMQRRKLYSCFIYQSQARLQVLIFKSSLLSSLSMPIKVANNSVASSWNFFSDWVVFRTNIVKQRILSTDALIKQVRQNVIQRLVDDFCQSNSFLIFSMRKFCPVNNMNRSVLKFSIFPQQSFKSTLIVYYNNASFIPNLPELSGQWRQFRGLGAETGRKLRKRKNWRNCITAFVTISVYQLMMHSMIEYDQGILFSH